MTTTLQGMHHVSALSAHIGRSDDFYRRVLGMRPLIRTVNQDAPSMYHLFYGDGAGRPGSEMTIFDLPRAAPERPGNSAVSLTTFRVAGAGTISWWAERFDRLGVARGEPGERDGRAVLDFADREGMQLSLVDDGGRGEAAPWEGSPVPGPRQLRGLGYVVATVPTHAPTHAFLTGALGLREARTYPVPEAPEHAVHVYEMAEGGARAEVHVAVRGDLPPARYGAGEVHHLALAVPASDAIEAWAARLDAAGYPNSGVVDRHYFASVYVREPGGILFELATEGPGFEVDGPIDPARLSLPPSLEPRRAEIEAALRPIEPEA
jgi:glyoxalase family protein